MKKKFEIDNETYGNLDWEIEDLLEPDFVTAFLNEFPDAMRQSKDVNGRVHRDFTQDGKPQLHRYVKENAMHADLCRVVELLKALRHYMCLKEPIKESGTIR